MNVFNAIGIILIIGGIWFLFDDLRYHDDVALFEGYYAFWAIVGALMLVIGLILNL